MVQSETADQIAEALSCHLGILNGNLCTLWLITRSLRSYLLRFARLFQIVKLILVIPHSNAEEERVFSMVRKSKTAFRPSLDPKGTLSSILTMKLANTQPAHSYEPSKEVLKRAKSATWDYNKAHSKKWLWLTLMLLYQVHVGMAQCLALKLCYESFPPRQSHSWSAPCLDSCVRWVQLQLFFRLPDVPAWFPQGAVMGVVD